MKKIYKNKADLIQDVIDSKSKVLDVGFWGQGTNINNPLWVHSLLKKTGADVHGIDIEFESEKLNDTAKYHKFSAENFVISETFDIVFAGDLIEHLSNPGLFLESSLRHLASNGKLIITTPNCFNLFNLAEKISKYEPTVNKDHTVYFNIKTLKQLLRKNGWEPKHIGYVFRLDVEHTESAKKKFLNVLYKFLSLFTDKYLETIVLVAVPASTNI